MWPPFATSANSCIFLYVCRLRVYVKITLRQAYYLSRERPHFPVTTRWLLLFRKLLFSASIYSWFPPWLNSTISHWALRPHSRSMRWIQGGHVTYLTHWDPFNSDHDTDSKHGPQSALSSPNLIRCSSLHLPYCNRCRCHMRCNSLPPPQNIRKARMAVEGEWGQGDRLHAPHWVCRFLAQTQPSACASCPRQARQAAGYTTKHASKGFSEWWFQAGIRHEICHRATVENTIHPESMKICPDICWRFPCWRKQISGSRVILHFFFLGAHLNVLKHWHPALVILRRLHS